VDGRHSRRTRFQCLELTHPAITPRAGRPIPGRRVPDAGTRLAPRPPLALALPPDSISFTPAATSRRSSCPSCVGSRRQARHRSPTSIEATMHDLRHAVRLLVRTPFVSTVAVLTLALGIGANAAIYSLFDQILVRPLPVAEPDRLVNVVTPGPKPGSTSSGAAGGTEAILSYPMYRDLEAAGAESLDLAAHRSTGANLTFAGNTVSGQVMLVSGSYFRVLGLSPALGR